MNPISKIFTPKRLKFPLSLKELKVDMHSHLIPGIDDGSRTMEESIMMDFYPNNKEIIAEGLKNLRELVKKEKIAIQIDAIAEYLIDESFMKILEKEGLISFGDKKYILIELSCFQPFPKLNEVLFELQYRGYSIILAHPERYLYWLNDFDNFKLLKDKEIYFQLNMSSFSGYYGFPVKRLAEKFSENNMVEFLGSDLHNHIYLKDIKDNVLYLKSVEKLLNSGKILNSTL
jgi:protein-tyrosine phosphatase